MEKGAIVVKITVEKVEPKREEVSPPVVGWNRWTGKELFILVKELDECFS